MAGHYIPPGWSYNPSERRKRLVLVGCACVRLAIAIYLSLYQLGLLSSVWEPFFGGGSETVLHSGIARLLPIPDALLGVIGYLVEVIAGASGGRDRWHAMPWLVVVYGLSVAGLGLVSVVLVILQPALFHAWCTLCLASAALSIAIVGPAMDEVLASWQFLRRESRRGRSSWNALWGRISPVQTAAGRSAHDSEGAKDRQAAPPSRFRRARRPNGAGAGGPSHGENHGRQPALISTR